MDRETASIFVEDQSAALTLYSDILGFGKVNDIDLDEFRWLTVSSDGSGETELLPEPNGNICSDSIEHVYRIASLSLCSRMIERLHNFSKLIQILSLSNSEFIVLLQVKPKPCAHIKK